MEPGNQFASWRPARGSHVPAQLALPFKGSPTHQALGFTELPMKEEEVAPIMTPRSEAEARNLAKAPTGRTRDIKQVWRGMSHDEWSQAQKQGHVRSDERGAIAPGWEGTNAALNRGSAEYYRDTNQGGRGGVLARIDVHPDDKWFLSDVDNYARTRRPIPLHRVHLED